MVPVDDTEEADDAEDESSSATSTVSVIWLSAELSSDASRASAMFPSLGRKTDRCRLLMIVSRELNACTWTERAGAEMLRQNDMMPRTRRFHQVEATLLDA